MRPAVFLDRDGVINKKMPEGSYVTRWEEFAFLSGSISAVERLTRHNIPVFVVTNQRGASRGLVSMEALSHIHKNMAEAFRAGGAQLTGIYLCAHDHNTCKCRKPLPGLLLEAARNHDIDLASSYTIGDSVSDIEAGRRAGTTTILLTGNPGRDHSGKLVDADYSCKTLDEAVGIILRNIAHVT